MEPAWLEAIFAENFFVSCSIHESAKKNEKNICCLDCCSSICPHCVMSHRLHRLLQIRRYVYHDVVRLDDLEKLIDCSDVQAYTINRAKVIFIKKRPQNRPFKGAGNYCKSCDRCLQGSFSYCSLGCKVEHLLNQYNDLSPFLRKCKVLQLGPDFFIPQDSGDDDDMTNETPHSHLTIVDCNEQLCSPSGSSGSENTSFRCTEFTKKKKSELYICGRSINKMSEEEMATSMSRRKGIPHRSPLC